MRNIFGETKEARWIIEHNENVTNIFETSVRAGQGSAMRQDVTTKWERWRKAKL